MLIYFFAGALATILVCINTTLGKPLKQFSPIKVESDSLISKINNLIQQKKYEEATLLYQQNKTVNFPESLNKDMMKVCKETGNTSLALSICNQELSKNPLADYWHIRAMQFYIYANNYNAATNKIPLIKNKNDDFIEIENLLFQEQQNWIALLNNNLILYEKNKISNELIDKILFCFFKLKASYAATNWIQKENIQLTTLRKFYILAANENTWLKWSNEVAANEQERIQFAENALISIDSLLKEPTLNSVDKKYLLYDKLIAFTQAKNTTVLYNYLNN
jgi:hypothetical protein